LKIVKEKFGDLPDGRQADLYTLENENGVQVQISNLGGVIRRVLVPDKKGDLGDVILGYKTFEEYIRNPHFFGALIGRSTNVMTGNLIEISGKTYVLDKNDGENNLHGGFNSLTYRLLNADVRSDNGEPSLVLNHTMEHLSDGFPGNLKVTVVYTLTNGNALKLCYQAVSDADTIISFTNHTHFNLSGHGSGTIEDHTLQIDADFYMPIDSACLPTGEILKVKDTPFDYRKAARIGGYIHTDCEQLNIYGGYDQNFVINGKGFRRAVTLSSPVSGRVLNVFTDLPGVHIYSCNLLKEGIYKDGAIYNKHQGVCFETQIFPDAVRMPWVLSPLHKAGEVYTTTTAFQFGL